jgi:hypothetical protein
MLLEFMNRIRHEVYFRHCGTPKKNRVTMILPKVVVVQRDDPSSKILWGSRWSDLRFVGPEDYEVFTRVTPEPSLIMASTPQSRGFPQIVRLLIPRIFWNAGSNGIARAHQVSIHASPPDARYHAANFILHYFFDHGI